MSVFPQIQDDLTVEMDLGGTWTDVTSYVFTRDPLTISRGRSDEASQVDPSRLTMTLDNRTGRFSPRNPLGAYYGLIGRNTPVRASVKRGAAFLDMPGDSGDVATTPDATALGITGDIDVRIDLTTPYWLGRDLCGKYETTGNQRSWAFQVDGDGTLVLAWGPLGTIASVIWSSSTLPVPLGPGRRALRATLDVNNGASGHTVTFYTASTISGPWVQLGDPVVTAGTTSIFDSTAPIEVGDVNDLIGSFVLSNSPSSPVSGHVNAFELRNGIAGSVVANPDFTAQAPGATSFADTASSPNTWTPQGNASITNRRWRFHGEMATLPSRWDVSGRDVYVPAEAAGITRRIGAAGTPLRSAIYRAILTEAGVVSYWPCEDGSDSKLIASGLPNGRPMTPSAPPSFGGSDVFEASESLPNVSNTSWAGPVAVYTPTSTAQVRFLISVPSGGTTNNAIVARILTTGTAARWDLTYTTGGTGFIGCTVYDSDGNVLKTTSSFGPVNGAPVRFSFELTQSGSNISVTLESVQPGNNTGGGIVDTVTSRTFSRIKTIIIDPTTNMDDVAIGHISVHSQITSLTALYRELGGWVGETAGRRIERLCGEEGITFRAIGNLDDTTALGIQRPGALLDLLRECEDADLGTLFEPREVLGIGYRTRSSLYNQDPAVAFDYANGELSDSLNPVPDDQNIHNSVTVSRSGGGSARVDITEGPLSTAPPPDGVGTYSDQPSVSLADDEQCAYQASWRAHLGTVDEDRYPQISVNFASGIAANATLVRQLLEHEVGDRLTVAHPPSWLPPDAISQLVQGYVETFTAFAHDMTLNCSPASPYEIAVYGADRYDTAGSQLASSATSSATSLSVATTLGPLWTTDPADLPLDLAVGGEHVQVVNNSTRITDMFTRSASSSWGTADTGQSWATSGGSAANYSATGSTGRVSCTDVTTRRFTSIGSAITDAAVIVSATTPVTAATDTITAGIVLRYTDDNNTYLAQVSFNPSGTVTLEVFKRVAGTFTSLGSQVDVTRYTPGVAVRIRAACVGSQISARVWTAGTPEPAWQVTASDAAFSSGKVGTKTSLGAGNTNTLPVAVDYDDLDMLTPAITGTSSPQTFTVVRSVNGLVKAHASGDDVRLYSPTYREL